MYTFTIEKLTHKNGTENGHNIHVITIEGGEHVKTTWSCQNDKLDVIQIGKAIVDSLNEISTIIATWEKKVKLLNHNQLIDEAVIIATYNDCEEDDIALGICTQEIKNRLRYYSNWMGLKDPYLEY